MKQQQHLDINEFKPYTIFCGGNGSGKSRKLRELQEYANVYNVNYKGGFSFELYEDEIKALAESLFGDTINYDHQLSASQSLIVTIAKEIIFILDLEPGVITFDSLPVSLDETRLNNLFGLFEMLVSHGYKVVFATAIVAQKDAFWKYFGPDNGNAKQVTFE